MEEEEEESEREGEDDELSDADAPAKRPAGSLALKFALKRPAAAVGGAAPLPKAAKADAMMCDAEAAVPAVDAAGLPKDRVLASGWVVRTHCRSDDDKQAGRMYHMYVLPTKELFRSLKQASNAGFRDE